MIVEVVVLLTIYFLVHHLYLKRRHLPPGPMPLPFVGNVLSLKNSQVEATLRKWHQKYGDIITVWIGNQPLTTLHNSKDIYETFLKDGEAYAGRPNDKAFNLLRGGSQGVAGLDNDIWGDHRKFVLQVLRNFGLGRNLMQERILTEVTDLVSEIKASIKAGVSEIPLADEIDRSVGSIINALAFGYRFGPENKAEFVQNKANIQGILVNWTNVWWRIMTPYVDVMKHLPFFDRVYAEVMATSDKTREFYLGNIEKRRQKINFDNDEDPADYVEAFLRHQHKLDQAGVKDHLYTDKQLYGTVFDLWLAGQETSSSTLCWLLIYLLRNPACLARVHQELDEVVGSDRVVTVDDKNGLNYLNAVLNECQRKANLLAFNVPHKTTRDVQIKGYHFPAGSLITHQISTVLSDARYFENPASFDPGRFLDEKGRFFSPPEVMPFGVGKRACLGEGLARMELFLFAANLLNQFEISGAGGMIPDDTRIIRGSIHCHPFKCEMKTRH